MNKQQFRKWLQAEIRQLSDPEPDLNQCEDAADTVRQAGRVAALLGYPALAQRCAITTRALALPVARVVLAECVAAVDSCSDMLTVQDAAQRLNVSPKTIYALVASGKLPCQRIGNGRGTIRLRPADLDRRHDPPRTGFKHLRL